MTKNIIIKTSVQKRFDSFMVHGRVLFFSAPCGFGKTVLADAGGVLHAFPRTPPCSRRGADAHGTANFPSALCGQVQRRDCTDHGREAAHGEDPRQPHSRQAGREAPGGSQDSREEAEFSAGRPVIKHPADVGFPYKSKTIF